jgi:hypothetical protein
VAEGRVEVDGNAVTLPVTDLEVDPGTHEILVESDDRRVSRSHVTMDAGERRTVDVGETRSAPPADAAGRGGGLSGLGVAGLIVGGIGVGGFVGAAVTGVMALDKRDELDACDAARRTDCAGIADAGNTLLIVNGVLWGVGIAGVGAGGTLLIVDLVADDGAEQITARVGPTWLGLEVRFR